MESLTLTLNHGELQLSAGGDGTDTQSAFAQAVQRLSVMLAEALEEDEVELFEVNGRFHKWDQVGRTWVPVSDAELEAIAIEHDLHARIEAAKKLIDHEADCDVITDGLPCTCNAQTMLDLLDGKGGNA